jgi:hypothetical protein
VDRDPSHVIAAEVHLAGVEACSDLELARSSLRPEREDAAESPTRPVEDRQDAVADALDQPAARLVDQPTGRLVMELE